MSHDQPHRTSNRIMMTPHTVDESRDEESDEWRIQRITEKSNEQSVHQTTLNMTYSGDTAAVSSGNQRPP